MPDEKDDLRQQQGAINELSVWSQPIPATQ